jgi:hypothetical protein
LKIKYIYIIIFSICFLSGCSGNATGNKLYIYTGYVEKLAQMGLEEVISLPSFHSPFITVAKDSEGKQYAVIFQENGQIDKKELNLSYDQIVNILQQKGLNKDDPNFINNLHLYVLNGKLYWNFTDSHKNIYLNTSGKEENPFPNK